MEKDNLNLLDEEYKKQMIVLLERIAQSMEEIIEETENKPLNSTCRIIGKTKLDNGLTEYTILSNNDSLELGQEFKGFS